MKNIRTRIAQSVVAGSVALSGAAFAELPTGATTAFSAVQTDALALVDLAWPAVIAVTSGFIILKLFKKAANKVG
jgi:hypothetical protein